MQMDRRTFVRRTAIAAGAVTLRQASFADPTSGAEPQGRDELLKKFKSPPKEFRPIARWWWPGDDVTEEELRREIGAMDEAGFGGAEIQAFFKGFDRAALSPAETARMNGFASPSFFEHVRAAADEAKKYGMFIDYTFGSGWPFGGGAAITPKLSAVELRWSHCSLKGPARFEGRLEVPFLASEDVARRSNEMAELPSEWAQQMVNRAKVVGVVAVRGEDAEWSFYQSGPRGRAIVKTGRLEDGTAVDLTQRMRANGAVEWDVPEGTWQVFVFVCAPTGQRVNGASGEGPQLVLDHLNADAFRAHAARVGDGAAAVLGEYFGNGIRAVFCDSLEVRANLFWSDDFLAEFRRRRGYALWPYLPVLQVQSVAEPFAKFVDTPFFDIEKRGAQVRHDYRVTVAELMKERFYDEFNSWAHAHKLLTRTQAHGAPVDVLQVYGDADIPETEQLYDQGTFDFLKLASSAAHIRGRAIVGSESFVWPGALYQTTPEKVKRAGDELFSAGVNAIVYHGFGYRASEMAEPGWHPFNGLESGNYSSQFNELNPLWPYFAKLNAYFTRLQYISQTSRNVAAVAIMRDALTHGAEQSPPTPELNQALMDAGYNYDHFHAAALSESVVRKGLLTTSGGAEYRALIVPSAERMDAEAVAHMRTFARQGLRVIFVGGTIHGMTGPDGVNAVADAADCVQLLERFVEPNARFHGRPVSFVEQRLEKRSAFFLRNESDAARVVDASFRATGEPELWDPWTGEVRGLPAVSRESGWSRIQLQLQPYGSALIIFSQKSLKGSAIELPTSSTIAHTVEIGASGWRFSASGMVGTNSAAKFSREKIALMDWSLDSELSGFSGRGTYSTTFTMSKIEKGSRLLLDLGDVREVAEVSVNAKPVTALLLRPYQVDVTEFVHAGLNTLEISVTNTLFNCMAMRTPRPFRPGPVQSISGLMPGGLLGPVQLNVMVG
jgi:hypothetical protein